MSTNKKYKFVVCVNNNEYPESLELFKIYKKLSDPTAESKGYIRVIDESGEDYLYDENYFVPIDPPTRVKSFLRKKASALA